MKYFSITFLLIFLFPLIIPRAQQEGNVEIFLIDAYVTPEPPHKFILSFFTTDSVKSKVVVDNKLEFKVSGILAEDHKTEIDFSGFSFDSSSVPFYIVVTDKNGNESRSENFELILPGKNPVEHKSTASPFLQLCIGGALFFMPSPGLALRNGTTHFTISKEIPFLTFYGEGYNYPSAYFSLEYTYEFKAARKNYLRIGYNKMFPVDYIEFVSPALKGYTDFLGNNGLSAELTLGLFKFYKVYAVYIRYRFNYQPVEPFSKFHEISIGLFSSFFSINF